MTFWTTSSSPQLLLTKYSTLPRPVASWKKIRYHGIVECPGGVAANPQHHEFQRKEKLKLHAEEAELKVADDLLDRIVAMYAK
jgi:hypothetical protein